MLSFTNLVFKHNKFGLYPVMLDISAYFVSYQICLGIILALKLIVAKVDHFHLKNCIFMYVTYSITPNGESSSVILNYLESQLHLHPRQLEKRILSNMSARIQGEKMLLEKNKWAR